LNQAIEKFRELGNREEEGVSYVELAKVLHQLGESDKAVEACHMARALLPSLHLDQAWIHRILGQILLTRGQREEAIRCLQKAAECFKRMEELHEWDATMYELARLYLEEKNLERAYTIMDDIRRYSRHILEERGIVL
jgi:tetratricopeptide (TPR) repeat protein